MFNYRTCKDLVPLDLDLSKKVTHNIKLIRHPLTRNCHIHTLGEVVEKNRVRKSRFSLEISNTDWDVNYESY